VLFHPHPSISVNPEVTGALIEAAKTCRGRVVDDAHLLAALARLGSVAHTLTQSGADAARIQARLADAIAQLPKRPWYRVSVHIGRPLEEAAALAAACGRKELDGPFTFATLAKKPDNADAARALADGSFSLLRFRRVIAHGNVVDPPCPEEGAVRVTLHDDPFTTVEFVVDVLRTVFGRDEATAKALTERVQSERAASLATMPAAEARAKMAELQARAAASDFPLRVTASAA
jgi:ATP-dependent Clp protease adaptor protein ClpS